MEKKEMEIVRHTTMNHLEVFIVEMTSRGPHGHDDFELGMILEGTMTLFFGTGTVSSEGRRYLFYQPVSSTFFFQQNRAEPHPGFPDRF